MLTIENNPSLTTGARKVDPMRGETRMDVSMQWMRRPADEKFATLRDLHDAKKAAFERSFSANVATKDFELLAPEIKSKEDLHRLTVGVSNVREPGSDIVRSVEVAPTHWSFSQMAQLAKSPAGFLRELPSPMAADVLNYRMRYSREVEEVKVYANPEELRAVTGPQYGRIPDFQIVEALIQIAGDGLGTDGFHWKTPGRMNWSNRVYDPADIGGKEDRTFYGSDRDLFVFLCDDFRPIEVGKLKDGSPDLVSRGFFISQSEMGSRALRLAAFYFRSSCCNRILWGVENFHELKINHTALAPDRWLQQARPALESFAEGSTRTLVEGVEAAKAAKVATDDDEALAFLQNRSFSKSAARSIMERFEQEEGGKPRTVWDMAQGITAYARDIPNNDDRLSVEMEAKKILDKVA